MGRLLAALIEETGTARPAKPANLANLRLRKPDKFADSQDSQEGVTEIARDGDAARILAALRSEGLPTALIGQVEPAETVGLSARALRRGAVTYRVWGDAMTIAEAAATGDRRTALEAMRDKLAADMDAAPPAVVAQIAGRLAAVLAELDGLPSLEVSKLDDLAKRRADRVAATTAVEPARRQTRQRRSRGR